MRQDYQAAVRDLNSAPGLTENILRARSGGMSDAHREIRDLYTDLRKGRITAKEFAAEMLRIRLDPASPTFAAQFADQIRIASERAQDLERQINAVADAAAKLGGKGGRVTSNPNEANPFDLRDRFGGVTGTLGKLDPAAMDGFRDQLRGQREGLEAYTDAAKAAQNALRNFDLSPVERQLADTAQTYDQRIAAYKRATTDTIGLAALQAEKEAALALISKEATRSEETRRAGYALDLKAVGDITAAQKAATAGQRAFNDAIGQGYDQSYAAARSAEASALTMAQARQQASQAATEQARATQRQIEQAQFEYDVVGKSVGEVARLRAEFELLAQAKDAARAAGFDDATVTLTDSMRQQAEQIGRLTEATQRLNFERDLLFDRQQATRSPEDQRIADQLRSIGVEFESAQGKADAAQLRLNNRLHEANDRLYDMRDAGKKAFGDLISSIGEGEGAIDSIAKAFAGLGQQLASAGFDRLFGNLFDGKSGDAKGGGLAGLLGQIGTTPPRIAANTNAGGATGYVPTPTARPTDFGQAAAAVSGQVMTYAKRFNSGVDTRLMTILETAAQRFPGYRVEAISGVASRPGNKGFHPKGMAADVQIYDASGRALNNYQSAADFRVYEKLAQVAKGVQQELFPALDKLFTFGGYFQGPKGKYGALDSMHFDLGGANRMQGGSWANGLTAKQRGYFPGVESVGMGLGSKSQDQRLIAGGVSQGMMDYSRRAGPEGYGGGRFDDAGAGSLPQMTRGQAGFGALTGLLGIAGAGYQSGNVFSGGLSGLMGGAELASQFGGALGLGSAAGPIGMGVGAAVGIISSPLGKRGPATRADMRRRFAAYQAQKGNGRDSDQCVLAA
ncbi:hypothetical protein [Aureimonas sp. AU4]|uniref:hypothetical protein n=1 Tax=Aureimonas sp. AU4 TaxID=1638163 RepID=UPI0012E3F591|nr:hypothetical protein [Aureimonas sp. AU4]